MDAILAHSLVAMLQAFGILFLCAVIIPACLTVLFGGK